MKENIFDDYQSILLPLSPFSFFLHICFIDKRYRLWKRHEKNRGLDCMLLNCFNSSRRGREPTMQFAFPRWITVLKLFDRELTTPSSLIDWISQEPVLLSYYRVFFIFWDRKVPALTNRLEQKSAMIPRPNICPPAVPWSLHLQHHLNFRGPLQLRICQSGSTCVVPHQRPPAPPPGIRYYTVRPLATSIRPVELGFFFHRIIVRSKISWNDVIGAPSNRTLTYWTSWNYVIGAPSNRALTY